MSTVYHRSAGAWVRSVAASPITPAPTGQPPGAVSGLTATPYSDRISVYWNASTDTDGDLSGYEVFLDGVSQGTLTATSTVIMGLTSGTSYTVGVRAYDSAGHMGVTTNLATATLPVSVSGGWQITEANTGAYAYYDTSLGRTLTAADLTTTAATKASQLTTSGGVITKKMITSDVFDIDIPCTLRACYVKGSLHSTTGATWSAEWCTADCSAATTWISQDTGVWGGKWTIYRCRIFGASDGLRGSDSQTATECHVRTFCRAADAHSDAYQYYNPTGGTSQVTTIERCNMDCRPTGGVGAANAAFFAADSTNLGTFYVRDNLLRGGAITIRCNDSGHYTVTGNRVVDDGQSPAGTFGAAVIDTWTNNVMVNETGTVLRTVPQP